MPDLFDPLRNLERPSVHPLPAPTYAARVTGCVGAGRRPALGGPPSSPSWPRAPHSLSNASTTRTTGRTPATATRGRVAHRDPDDYPSTVAGQGPPTEESGSSGRRRSSPRSPRWASSPAVPRPTRRRPAIDSVGADWNAAERPATARASSPSTADSATASTVTDRMVDAWQPARRRSPPPFERNYVVTRSSFGDDRGRSPRARRELSAWRSSTWRGSATPC